MTTPTILGGNDHSITLAFRGLYENSKPIYIVGLGFFRFTSLNAGEKAIPEVDRFDFFGESQNGFLFRSIKMRDEFNQQLKLIKASGQHQEIMKKYNYKPGTSVP